MACQSKLELKSKMKFDSPRVTRCVSRVWRDWLIACCASCLGWVPPAIGAEPLAPFLAHTGALEAQFRGCQSRGWCRFWIGVADSRAESLLRVRPEGVSPLPAGDVAAVAVRDRLNALLASMIHQHKRIVLHDLRPLEDGMYVAVVTVNGIDVASDPVLLELLEASTGASR